MFLSSLSCTGEVAERLSSLKLNRKASGWGKQVDWLVKPSTLGDAKKNAWISYVADFGNRILNRTWHGKYMKIRTASFSFWGCQNLKHKRQHRQRLKMGKAWIFRQALTIQKRQQTSANQENFGKTWKIKDVSGQSKQQIQQTLRGAVPYIVPQKGWRKLVGCENWNTLHDKEHAGKVHLFPHVKNILFSYGYTMLHTSECPFMPVACRSFVSMLHPILAELTQLKDCLRRRWPSGNAAVLPGLANALVFNTI